MARRGVMVGLLLLVAGFLAPMIMSPANAADNGVWSVTPVKKKNELTQRQFFFYEASKGQTIRDAITIVNPSPEDLVLDRVCHTHVPRSGAVVARVAGREEHFCSAACRDKALAAVARAS